MVFLQMHQHADANQMNETNLAIVFGPNLLRPPPVVGGTGLTEMGDAGKVISLMRLLLQNYDYFFVNNVATAVGGVVIAP